MASINASKLSQLQEMNRDEKSVQDKKRKREGDEGKLAPYGAENDPARSKKPRINIPHVFTAPVLWTSDVGADGTAILVEESKIIIGTADGRILYLDMNGVCQRQIQLIHPVGSIFKEGNQMFAWCYPRNKFQPWKGVLYELRLTEPRLLFDVEGFGEWLKYACMIDGCLALADDKGTVGFFGCDGELLWKREETEGFGGLLAADEEGVYISTRKYVRKLRATSGEEIWEHELTGSTRHAGFQYGVMEGDSVFVEGAGKVLEINRKSGTVEREIVPTRHRAGGITIGNGQLVTGSCPSVIFDIESGEEMYRMNFSGRLDKAETWLHSSGKLIAFWDKVYCINLTTEGVMRAVEGRSQRTLEVPLAGEVPDFAIEEPFYTTEHADGIPVKCVMVDGKPTGRTEDPEYNDAYNVRLPMTWKIEGNVYYMDKLVESKIGQFYRPEGNIRLSKPEVITTPERTSISTPTSVAMTPGTPSTPQRTPRGMETSPHLATPFRRGPEADVTDMKPLEEIDLSAGIITVPPTGETPIQGTRNKWTPVGVKVTPSAKQEVSMDTSITPSRKESPGSSEFPKIMRPSARLFDKSQKSPSPKKNSPSQK